MRILGIERDETACNHYRVLQPIYKLRQLGLADTLTIEDWNLDTEEATQKVLDADIVLFQRPASEEWFKFIKLCQKYGKLIVCDYDDDPFSTHPLNPYYKFIGTKNYSYKWPTGEEDMIWQDGENGFDIERNIIRQDMFRASYRNSDMITTTTPILAEEFKKLNKNTVVLPNLIDFDYYRPYEMKKDDTVRIGYQGGASHYEDLYEFKGALERVLKANKNAKFVYFGDLRFKKLFQNIPTPQLEFNDWVKFVAYPYKLPLMNIDIGVCPLVDNKFNRNKSALKFFEYSATGSATVASNIPPYSEVITDGENGLLAKTEDEWVECLTDLIKDAEKRNKLKKNAYDLVYQEHNAEKQAYLWRDAYQSIINQEIMV